ncbi:peptidyl-tRNA hydrolase [Coemansia reversa NRRL 1564]|uniref:peptidyl-tRNA hydrolase n=1 Tax=Coemansia reversa (strain ATCC 12441 / NRRL 1564) TaxID=763665 RepID=A0A2G5B3I9_COERN|nr:peptidyl-tRNA hydrolase [Coemansia reversa NRRL 1564]|eukprot:PIA13551.1 peptidyl-tRNA hydrolase [Coemansia reversa NRRL 1564]
MAASVFESVLTTKVPFWQVMLFGGTTFIAGKILQNRQLLLRNLFVRNFHTSSTTEGLPKKIKRKSKSETPVLSEDMKMVLVIRTDLGMTKGKIAAQCSHATLACYKQGIKKDPTTIKAWEWTGQTKVTLKCSSEEELLELQNTARSNGLISQSICDAGRTQIVAGSRTVLGIGPGPAAVVDRVTGHLSLY